MVRSAQGPRKPQSVTGTGFQGKLSQNITGNLPGHPQTMENQPLGRVQQACSDCGAPVSSTIPEGDNKPRYVCTACATVHYENPKLVVGCVTDYEGKILLCKRAIEPRYGLWTVPAGFMENGESTEQAAMRETWEEAGAEVMITSLYSIFSIPHISQVYMLFRGELIDGHYQAGNHHQQSHYCRKTFG